jgi:hypothetical protein
LDSTVNASSESEGSGIGTGSGLGSAGILGYSTVGALTISNCTVIATGIRAGIGHGGEGTELGSLTLSGTMVVECNGGASYFPVTARSIIFSDASLLFVTRSTRVLGVAPSRQGSLTLKFLYGSVVADWAEPLDVLDVRMLQIGNLTGSLAGPATFCASENDHCVTMQSTALKSVMLPFDLFPTIPLEDVDPRFALLDGVVDHAFIARPAVRVATPLASRTPVPSVTPRDTPSPSQDFTVSLMAAYASKKMSVFDVRWFLFEMLEAAWP